MHEIVEDQKAGPVDKFLLWEAARLIINGVNARPGNESLKEVKP